MQKEKSLDHRKVFVHWGDCFVETFSSPLSTHDQKASESRYFYNPKNEAKLADQIADLYCSTDFPQEWIIEARFLERYFSFSLGGSVAQIYLDPQLKAQEHFFLQKLEQGYESIEKAPSLGSSLLEVDFDPECPVDQEKLKSILEKLKIKGARRVVIHGETSSKNMDSFQKMKSLSADFQLEIFPRSANELGSERSFINLVDACLHGRFSEFHENLSQRLGQKSNIASIFYLSRRGLKKFQELLPSDLLGATETCYEKFLSENKIDFVLDLGLEKFTLITRENHQSFSNSSFSLESFLPCREILSTQLLNPIELDRNQRGSIGKETLSFEPGPLFLGRGQKLTALDGFMHRALDQRQSPFGNQDLRDIFLTKDCDLKFRRTETALKTLAKNSLYSSQTGSEFRDLILEEFIRKLWSELALRVSAGSKGLAAGPMIDLIFPERRSEYLENGSFILPIQKTNFKLQVTKDFF